MSATPSKNGQGAASGDPSSSPAADDSSRLLYAAVGDEVPDTKHVVSTGAYLKHFGGIVSSDDLVDFKSKFGAKKWKEKFRQCVGGGRCFEHNHHVYVKGYACTDDPKRVFRFVQDVRNSWRILRALILKHKAKGAYEKLSEIDKYQYSGDLFDSAQNVALRLANGFPTVVLRPGRKRTAIAAELKVVEAILELCGDGLLDLSVDFEIDPSSGVKAKTLTWTSTSRGVKVSDHAAPPPPPPPTRSSPDPLTPGLEDGKKLSAPTQTLPTSFELSSFILFETEEDASRLALLEYIVQNADDLQKYDEPGDIKHEIQVAWRSTSLPFPLAVYRDPRPAVEMADVLGVLRLLKRRYMHDTAAVDNTSATRNREGLLELIEAGREEHRERLAKDQRSLVALALRSCFASIKSLLECFPKEPQLNAPTCGSDDDEPATETPAATPTYEKAKEGEGNLSRWLAARKQKWREKSKYWKSLVEREQKRDLRSKQRAPTEIPELDPMVSWKVINSQTRQLYLPYEKAAGLRYIRNELLIPIRSMPSAISLFYAFFTGKPIPPGMVVSAETMSVSDQGLGERDDHRLSEEWKELKEKHPNAKAHSVTDDTKNGGVEHHQEQLSLWDSGEEQPSFRMLTIKSADMKTSGANARANASSLEKVGIDGDDWCGGCGDRPGLLEFSIGNDEFKAKIPDEDHTEALHHKYFSEGAFGRHTGLDNRHHYVQLLDTLYRLQWDKIGRAVWGALVRRFLSDSGYTGDVKPFHLSFHDSNTGRWKYRSIASDVVLKLQGLKVLGQPFLESFLKYIHNLESGQAVRDMISYSAASVSDPRFVVAMTAEVEYKEEFYDRATAWLCSKTASGWPRTFAVIELADRLEWTDKPRNKRLSDNWKEALPKTAAAIAAVASSDRTGDSAALASQLTGQIENGVKARDGEILKNYRWLYTPQYSLLWLFCRKRSGACSRAIFAKLQALGHFQGAEFEAPDEDADDDKYFVDLLEKESAGEEVENIFRIYGLLDGDLADCFVEMSKNSAETKEDDSLVASLVAGKALAPLFDKLKVSLCTLPIRSVLVEMRFSEMKQRKAANKSPEKLDLDMAFSSNALTADKRLRRETFGGNGSARTSAQEVVMLGRQMIEHSELYTEECMKQVSSRRQLKGNLRKREAEDADSSVVAMKDARGTQQRRKAVTDDEWRERQLEFTATQTPHEVALKAVDDLLDRDRVLAVLREEKFAGQDGRSAKFYSNLRAGEFKVMVSAHFPVIHGTFMPLIERKREEVVPGDRRRYAPSANGRFTSSAPLPFSYSTTTPATKGRGKRRSATTKVTEGLVMGIRIGKGMPIEPKRKIKKISAVVAKDQQAAFFGARDVIDRILSFMGKSVSCDLSGEKAIIQGRGYFVRAHRGDILDRSLQLDDDKLELGPAAEVAKKRKIGE